MVSRLDSSQGLLGGGMTRLLSVVPYLVLHPLHEEMVQWLFERDGNRRALLIDPSKRLNESQDSCMCLLR